MSNLNLNQRGSTLLAYDDQLVQIDLLLAGLAADVLALPISRDVDAITTISAALAASGARRLILLCHGAAGQLQLGSRPVGRKLIEAEQLTIASWQLQSLDLYACHVAADAQMMPLLHRVAGCPVAASRGRVGHALLQGSWELDIRLGHAETAGNRIIPFSREARETWVHALEPRYVGPFYLAFTPYYASIWQAVAASSSSDVLIIDPGTYNDTVYGSSVIVSVSQITVSNTQLNAGDLVKLAEPWGGSIDASAVTLLTGTSSDILAAFNSTNITNLNDPFLTVTNSSITAAAILSLDSKTSKLVTFSASSISGSATEITNVYNAISNGTINGLTNATPTITDSSINASQIIAIDLLTTKIPVFTATTITGAAADIYSAYLLCVNAGLVAGLGNESVTISGINQADEVQKIAALTSNPVTATIAPASATTLLSAITESGNALSLTLTDAAITASDLILLDNRTTVAVDASSLSSVTGSITDLLSVYGSSGIINLGKETVTVTSSTASAASLKSLLTSIPTGSIQATALTTITGNPTDIITVLTSSRVSRSASVDVTIDSGTSANATDLNSIDANTAGTVNATGITTITGTAANVALAMASAKINKSASVGVTITGGTTVASDLYAIDTKTSGIVNVAALSTLTGAVSDLYAVYNSLGFSGLGNETIVLTDESADANLMAAIKAKSSGQLNASSVTQLSGSAFNCLFLYTMQTAGTISGLGDENIQLTGTTSVSDANKLNDSTAGIITASITPSSITDLLTLTGTNNAYSLTVTDLSVDALSLLTLDTKTTAQIDATGVTSLTGSASSIALAISSGGLNFSGSVGAVISGSSVNAADLNMIAANTSDFVNALVVTTITGTASAIAKALSYNNILRSPSISISISAGSANATDLTTIATKIGTTVDATPITILTGTTTAILAVLDNDDIQTSASMIARVSAGSVDAASLNNIDSKINTEVDATLVTTLTGTANDINAAINASQIATAANVAVKISSGAATVDQANSIDAQTTGVITATISNGDISTLATLTGKDNAYSITVTDLSVDAGALNSLNDKTTVKVNANAVTSLTGSANAIITASKASTGLGITTTWAANVSSGTATVSQANSIDAATSGVVTATIGSGDMASLASLAIPAGTNNAYDITITDTSVSAAALNTLNDKTSVDINMAAVGTMTGTLASLKAVYDGTGIRAGDLGDEQLKLTNTSISATELPTLNALNLLTSGAIDASTVTQITGALTDIDAAYGTGITNLGTSLVTITNTSLNNANLITLESINSKTSGNLNLASATSISGLPSTLITLFTTTGYAGLGNEAISLDASDITASDLNTLDSKTIGIINAANISSVTGSMVDLLKAYGSSGITGLAAKPIVLTDVLTTAANLNSLDGLSTGLIDATSLKTISGSIPALSTAYSSAGISNLNCSSIVLTDTTLTSTLAASLNALNQNPLTTGTIKADTVTSMTGALATLNSLYAANDGTQISGLGNETVTLTDSGTVLASELNTLRSKTSGNLNIGSVSTISGLMNDVTATYKLAGVTGRGDEAVLLTDATVLADDLNALNPLTTGNINLANVTSINGSLASLNTVFTTTGFTNTSGKTTVLTNSLSAALDVTPTQFAILDKTSNKSSYRINYIGNTLNNAFTGYGLNDILSGAAGNDSLNGGGGADTLEGGLGKDMLTGGLGNDTFLYSALGHSLLSGFDVITDFQIGSDILDGPTAVSSANVRKPSTAVSTLSASSIAAVLTAANLPANGAAIFTMGTTSIRTFVVLNDSVAGFSASTDALIEITGYTGSLSSFAVS